MKLLAQSIGASAQPASSVSSSSPAPLTAIQGVFTNVVSVAVGLAAIILFIMFVAGGFSYLTAGGNPQKIEGARKTLTYAIGGIVLIAVSYLILVLIKTFTGVNVTTFSIYKP